MICTIINYCTNDYRMIGRCIREAAQFSSSILVPVCDHFFDGAPENRRLLNYTYAEFPHCQFIEYVWNVKRLYIPFLPMPNDEEERIRLWHSTSRFVGCHFLPADAEYILFLDADEIAEGQRLASYLASGGYRRFAALWFLSYTYRFSASERRLERQYAPLLVRINAMEKGLVLNTKERFGLLQSIVGELWLAGQDDRPFFHHYSWVRSHSECLQKVQTWGRKMGSNWPQRLKQCWQNNRFLDDEPFEKVAPFFDPMSVRIPRTALRPVAENVAKTDDLSLFRQTLAGLYGAY